MPRVLILCEHPTLLGGERSLLTLLEFARLGGFDPTVMGPPEGPLAEACAVEGVALTPFQSLDFQGRRLPQSHRREELASQWAQTRPDLIHANSLSMARLAGPVAAALGIPCVGHIRDIVGLSRRAVDDVNRCTRLLAVSEAARRFHVAAGLDAARTHILYNGVDLQRFQPRWPNGYLHRELGLPSAARLVGVIGQIGPRKGQDVLADAASLLAEELPDVHFAIVGRRWSEKDESRDFERRLSAAAESLPGRFHFLGVRRDVDRILNELSLLVHPARQEPLGRVLLEASASGTPVVATSVGGTPEIFPPDSDSALLVPSDDPAALSEAIRAVLLDPSLAERLAAGARRRAEECFDRRQAGQGLLAHYQAAMDDAS